MLYLSWGQGTKSGGFAQSVTDLPNAGYAPEVAQTTELGVKYQGADRGITVNAAAFHTYVSQYQLVTFDGVGFQVGNTDLESDGVESDVVVVPIRGLRLFWNNTYADAYNVPTGQAIPRAPRWTGVVGGALVRPVSQTMQAEMDVTFNYRTRETQQENRYLVPTSPSFNTLNATLSLGSSDHGWSVQLIGRNLLNRRGYAFTFPDPVLQNGNAVTVPERPMTVTLELAKHF